jgi:hypothetical protein
MHCPNYKHEYDNFISTAMIKTAVRFAWQTQHKIHFYRSHFCGSVVTASRRLYLFAPEQGLLKRYGRKTSTHNFSLCFCNFLFVLTFCWNVKQVHLKVDVSMNTANTQTSLLFFPSELDAFLSVKWWGFSCIIRVQMTSTHLLFLIRLHLHAYFVLALITQ